MAYSPSLVQSTRRQSSHILSSILILLLSHALFIILLFILTLSHSHGLHSPTLYYLLCLDHLDSDDANVDAALPAAHDEDLQMKDLLCLLRLANR
jgi:hypothetical protein